MYLEARTHIFCDSYPIQYCRPTFHRDALKYRQHSKPNIVKTGDSIIGAVPLFVASAIVVVANICARWC